MKESTTHEDQIKAVIDKGLAGIRDIARTMVAGGLKNLSRRDLEKFVRYVAFSGDPVPALRATWLSRFKAWIKR